MCVPGIDPVTMAMIAATTGAGALYNADTQNNAIKAQNKAEEARMVRQQEVANAERKRQMSFENEQAAAVSRALFEAAPEQIVDAGEQAAADVSNPIVAAAEQYNVPTLTGQVDNQDVNDSIGATVGKAMQRTKGMLGNAAKLSGQNEGFTSAIQALTRMGSQVQTIGSKRAGSSRAAAYEGAIAAASVTKSGSPIGDLLMLGGQLGSGAAGYNAGLAGGEKPFDISSIFRKAE